MYLKCVERVSDNTSPGDGPFELSHGLVRVCAVHLATDVVAITSGCDYYCAVLCRQITASRLLIRSKAGDASLWNATLSVCGWFQSLDVAGSGWRGVYRTRPGDETPTPDRRANKRRTNRRWVNGTIAGGQCSLGEMIPRGHLQRERKVNSLIYGAECKCVCDTAHRRKSRLSTVTKAN